MRWICLFLLATVTSTAAHGQLSLLPVSSREGISGNTSIARAYSSLAPLSNPASGAPMDESFEAGRANDPEASISSNVYLVSQMEFRGRGSQGEVPPEYMSIPTSLGGRKRLGNAYGSFGLYQTERYQFAYRSTNAALGRTVTSLDVNRVAGALAFHERSIRYGIGACVSSLKLRSTSHYNYYSDAQNGTLVSAWEDRSRLDATASIGAIYDASSTMSVGLFVRSPSLGLWESVDGQQGTARVATGAGSSSLTSRGPDPGNNFVGSGVEGAVGFGFRSGVHQIYTEFAVHEYLGSVSGSAGGEALIRIGDEYRYSDAVALLFGINMGLADALGHEVYPGRKAIPIMGSFGFERRIDESKRLVAGVFHENSIDWEIEPTASYGVFQRTGVVLSGSLSF